jgi:hypothetical protein
MLAVVLVVAGAEQRWTRLRQKSFAENIGAKKTTLVGSWAKSMGCPRECVKNE